MSADAEGAVKGAVSTLTGTIPRQRDRPVIAVSKVPPAEAHRAPRAPAAARTRHHDAWRIASASRSSAEVAARI